MEPGEMVKGDSTAPMRLSRIAADGMAECVQIDADGFIVRRYRHINSLRSMSHVFQPRTCWPVTQHFDHHDVEEEKRVASEARRQKRRAARRGKRSNKIKRRAPVAA